MINSSQVTKPQQQPFIACQKKTTAAHREDHNVNDTRQVWTTPLWINKRENISNTVSNIIGLPLKQVETTATKSGGAKGKEKGREKKKDSGEREKEHRRAEKESVVRDERVGGGDKREERREKREERREKREERKDKRKTRTIHEYSYHFVVFISTRLYLHPYPMNSMALNSLEITWGPTLSVSAWHWILLLTAWTWP